MLKNARLLGFKGGVCNMLNNARLLGLKGGKSVNEGCLRCIFVPICVIRFLASVTQLHHKNETTLTLGLKFFDFVHPTINNLLLKITSANLF